MISEEACCGRDVFQLWASCPKVRRRHHAAALAQFLCARCSGIHQPARVSADALVTGTGAVIAFFGLTLQDEANIRQIRG